MMYREEVYSRFMRYREEVYTRFMRHREEMYNRFIRFREEVYMRYREEVCILGSWGIERKFMQDSGGPEGKCSLEKRWYMFTYLENEVVARVNVLKVKLLFIVVLQLWEYSMK